MYIITRVRDKKLVYMQLFFSQDINNNLITLSEEESRHAIKVLRKNIGSPINVVDGVGTLYKTTIIEAHPKHTVLEIDERIEEFEKLPYSLHIAVATTKNIDRTEWFMEKATEIGIGSVTLIKSEHSERKIAKIERLERVAISAMKQSVKAYMPMINDTTPFMQFIKADYGDAIKLIAHCNGAHHKSHIKELIKDNRDVIVMIGPEGDFSCEEVAEALKNGFQEISLGSQRLRTETAALYAVAAVAINFSSVQ